MSSRWRCYFWSGRAVGVGRTLRFPQKLSLSSLSPLPECLPWDLRLRRKHFEASSAGCQALKRVFKVFKPNVNHQMSDPCDKVWGSAPLHFLGVWGRSGRSWGVIPGFHQEPDYVSRERRPHCLLWEPGRQWSAWDFVHLGMEAGVDRWRELSWWWSGGVTSCLGPCFLTPAHGGTVTGQPRPYWENFPLHSKHEHCTALTSC
jgi:hypothetical protein